MVDLHMEGTLRCIEATGVVVGAVSRVRLSGFGGSVMHGWFLNHQSRRISIDTGVTPEPPSCHLMSNYLSFVFSPPVVAAVSMAGPQEFQWGRRSVTSSGDVIKALKTAIVRAAALQPFEFKSMWCGGLRLVLNHFRVFFFKFFWFYYDWWRLIG